VVAAKEDRDYGGGMDLLHPMSARSTKTMPPFAFGVLYPDFQFGYVLGKSIMAKY